jgi:hypothetical protein
MKRHKLRVFNGDIHVEHGAPVPFSQKDEKQSM